MSNQITLNQEQVNSLVNAFKSAIDILTANQPVTAKPVDVQSSWNSASTTTVSFYTLEQYDWKPLRKYCVDNNLTIFKETVGAMELNSYPREAWKAVYGIELGKFNV